MYESMIAHAEANNVDYIKFQLYDTNKLNPEYPNFEETKSRLSLAELTIEDVDCIFELCKPLNITPMFTIFHEQRCEWLRKHYLEETKFALKIASPNMMDIELIDAVIGYFPNNLLLISTGMHTTDEIIEVREDYEDNKNVKWLYCKSMYPTPIECIDFDLMGIQFDGISDHSVGLRAIKTFLDLYDLEFIEKHFILSRALPFKDREWSVEPGELRELMSIIKYKETTSNFKKRWI
jgi:N-acetylneuraminate synthase